MLNLRICNIRDSRQKIEYMFRALLVPKDYEYLDLVNLKQYCIIVLLPKRKKHFHWKLDNEVRAQAVATLKKFFLTL